MRSHIPVSPQREALHTQSCQAFFGPWFKAKEGLRVMDSSCDLAVYRATPLQCLPHQAYIQDMAKLGIVDIALELLQEMSDQSKHKQQFNTEAMQKVVDHVNLKPCEGSQFSQVNSMALALTVNTHTMDGNQTLHSITSMQVVSDLGRAHKEFLMLAVHLQELAPDHAIFEQQAFSDKALNWSPFALGNLRKCTASTRRPEITASVSESV
jgi:hypothetical protein